MMTGCIEAATGEFGSPVRRRAPWRMCLHRAVRRTASATRRPSSSSQSPLSTPRSSVSHTTTRNVVIAFT